MPPHHKLIEIAAYQNSVARMHAHKKKLNIRTLYFDTDDTIVLLFLLLYSFGVSPHLSMVARDTILFHVLHTSFQCLDALPCRVIERRAPL